ncbi:unnamed protein product [Cochlearia groenlandica]
MTSSPSKSTRFDRKSPKVVTVQPSSPRFPITTPTSGSQRKIGIAVDLSDESAYAVEWSVQNYLRSGDAVFLLHVQPTSVLYGADWGSVDLSPQWDPENLESQKKLEDDFDVFTNKKASDVAQPLVEGDIPFKIHIVKDHDMKERLCLEVERLGLSTLIMGSRGFGAAAKRSGKGRLGSVSDYSVHHCACPVVVVRFPDDKDVGEDEKSNENVAEKQLHTVPEVREEEYHDDVSDKEKADLCCEYGLMGFVQF